MYTFFFFWKLPWLWPQNSVQKHLFQFSLWPPFQKCASFETSFTALCSLLWSIVNAAWCEGGCTQIWRGWINLLWSESVMSQHPAAQWGTCHQSWVNQICLTYFTSLSPQIPQCLLQRAEKISLLFLLLFLVFSIIWPIKRIVPQLLSAVSNTLWHRWKWPKVRPLFPVCFWFRSETRRPAV